MFSWFSKIFRKNRKHRRSTDSVTVVPARTYNRMMTDDVSPERPVRPAAPARPAPARRPSGSPTRRAGYAGSSPSFPYDGGTSWSSSSSSGSSSDCGSSSSSSDSGSSSCDSGGF